MHSKYNKLISQKLRFREDSVITSHILHYVTHMQALIYLYERNMWYTCTININFIDWNKYVLPHATPTQVYRQQHHRKILIPLIHRGWPRRYRRLQHRRRNVHRRALDVTDACNTDDGTFIVVRSALDIQLTMKRIAMSEKWQTNN